MIFQSSGIQPCPSIVNAGTVAMDGTVRRAATVQMYGATMIAQPRAAEPEPAEPVGGTFLRHDVEQITSSLQQRGEGANEAGR